jgi:hypothetical protein
MAVDLPAIEVAHSGAQRVLSKFQAGEPKECIKIDIKAEPNTIDLIWNAKPPWNQRVQEVIDAQVTQFIALAKARTEEVEGASRILLDYITQLRGICSSSSIIRYAPLTEEEVIAGTFIAKTSQQRVRQNQMSRMRDSTLVLVRDICDELRGEDDDFPETRLRCAWIA